MQMTLGLKWWKISLKLSAYYNKKIQPPGKWMLAKYGKKQSTVKVAITEWISLNCLQGLINFAPIQMTVYGAS